MRRHPDWATRLDVYIAANASMPFSYERANGLDCCTFAFGAIHAMTGIAIGAQFVGIYSTKRESLIAMRSYCGSPSLRMAIAKLMTENKFGRRPPLFAQRGDAVLVPNGPAGEFFGVVDLNGRDVLGIGDRGIRRVPISIECRAWRI